MNTFKKYIEAQRQKARFERDAETKADFRVVERCGDLWLTHKGVAFKKIAPSVNSGDVALKLNEARECAVEFDRL